MPLTYGGLDLPYMGAQFVEDLKAVTARLTYTIEVMHRDKLHTREIRHRLDAARAAAKRAVYAAYSADGRLDSLVAHTDIRQAYTWDGEDALLFKIGAYEITATMSRRHK